MNFPSNLKYTESNEWLYQDGSQGSIGITDFAQDQLSDVVFVEILVSPGDSIRKGDAIATVESVKAAAEVYSPVSGKVINTNDSLANTPEMINQDPYGAAWMIKIEFTDPGEIAGLMDASAYQAFCEEQG